MVLQNQDISIPFPDELKLHYYDAQTLVENGVTLHTPLQH
jgi:hypothetical protein